MVCNVHIQDEACTIDVVFYLFLLRFVGIQDEACTIDGVFYLLLLRFVGFEISPCSTFYAAAFCGFFMNRINIFIIMLIINDSAIEEEAADQDQN